MHFYAKSRCVLLLAVLLPWFTTVMAQTPNRPTPLINLINQMLLENPALQSAEQEVKAAFQKIQADSQALYNPELELDIENTQSNTYSIGISQTLDWGDKRSALKEKAQAEYQIAKATQSVLRQQLMQQLLSGLASYHLAQAQVDLAQRRLNIMQQFADVAEQRHRAGDLSQIELDLAELAQNQAYLQHAQTLLERVTVEQALLAIAPKPEQWPRLEQASSLPHVGSTQKSEQWLQNLPIIRQQKARLAAAKADIAHQTRAKKADPTISLRGGQEDNEILTGITLSIPLFVRNRYSAEVNRAQHLSLAIEQQAQTLYRKAKSDLQAALQRYLIIDKAWQTWQQNGQSHLKNQVTLLQRLWKIGELSTTEYIVQLKETLETQASALQLNGQRWQAWITWLQATGKIESWLGVKNEQQ